MSLELFSLLNFNDTTTTSKCQSLEQNTTIIEIHDNGYKRRQKSKERNLFIHTAVNYKPMHTYIEILNETFVKQSKTCGV